MITFLFIFPRKQNLIYFMQTVSTRDNFRGGGGGGGAAGGGGGGEVKKNKIKKKKLLLKESKGKHTINYIISQ